MKTRSFIIAAVCLCVLTNSAFAEPAKYAARINVTGNLKKDRTNSKNESSKKSSKSKTEKQFYELKVTVSNTLKQEATFDLEWYFFKRPLDNKGNKEDAVLAGKDKTTLTIGGMKRVTQPITSDELSWTETKSNSTSNNKKNSKTTSKKSINGSVYDGYVILVRAEGEIIAKYSNDKKFISDEWLPMLQQ